MGAARWEAFERRYTHTIAKKNVDLQLGFAFSLAKFHTVVETDSALFIK